ncbi:MAG: endonuclease/exonuclease/phosphatase family protein [Acidimicrobiia bacterium]|nr:endonuclease/exonuclease/phosphatase family protein [Acidimicrobiia bacterium]
MRLLTWNLWWRFGKRWQDRQLLIGAELRRVKADVCAFQEVYSVDGEDQFDALREATLLDGCATEHRGERVRFGNALLSRYPLEHVTHIRLPGSGGGLGHRSAIVADVDCPNGPLSLAVTHLEWRYDASHQRQQQLLPILQELARRRDQGRIPVLMGDLNSIPASDELRRLTGSAPPFEIGNRPLVFTDSWAAVGDGPGYTWNRDNSNAADAAFPRRRLDHILVGWPRPKPVFNPRAAELVGVEPGPDGLHPSDHYGVLVTVDGREPFEE